MEPFIGQIVMFGGNFAPRSWAFCNGQLLSIAQNTALFSILGTIYGGDGRTTFALPDLRGRVAMHYGSSQGPGLSNYRLGQRGGTESTTLTLNNMPSHNHNVGLRGETALADSKNPNNRLLAVVNGDSSVYGSSVPDTERVMHPDSISQENVGGNVPFDNRMPFQTVNYIIALFGIFPSRN